MKQLRNGWGSRLSASMALITLFCGLEPNSASSAQVQLATPSSTGARAQELRSEGQAWLRAAIGSGRFDDLRWPDFSDYSKHVQKAVI